MRIQCEYLWAKRKRKTRETVNFRVKTAKRMQANMAHEAPGEITANDLAQKLGKGVDGIRIKYSALFAEGHPLFVAKFDRHAPLSPAQIEVLSPSKNRNKKASVPDFDVTKGRSKEAAPIFKMGWTWQTWVFVIGAFLLVIGHGFLIWYDMSVLWSMPGKIGGGVVFSFILIGMVLMSEKRPEMAETRENMLWAVGALEALAVVVHQATFYRSASEAFVSGLGVPYTWALAAVVCLCSIGATIFYKNVIK